MCAIKVINIIVSFRNRQKQEHGNFSIQGDRSRYIHIKIENCYKACYNTLISPRISHWLHAFCASAAYWRRAITTSAVIGRQHAPNEGGRSVRCLATADVPVCVVRSARAAVRGAICRISGIYDQQRGRDFYSSFLYITVFIYIVYFKLLYEKIFQFIFTNMALKFIFII